MRWPEGDDEFIKFCRAVFLEEAALRDLDELEKALGLKKL